MNALADINFLKLLRYESIPPHRAGHKSVCHGFCTSCEINNLVPDNICLDRLSHGCHSDVFFSILGDFKTHQPPVTKNILFLLESPGSDSFGAPVEVNGVKKRPPVNGYYFSPPCKTWPDDPSKIKSGYGDQFAFLIKKFNLRSVYFTNVVKCGKTTLSNKKWQSYKNSSPHDRKIAKNCYNEFLSEEIEAFSPDVIFSFGGNAFWLYEKNRDNSIAHRQLMHPASRMSLKKSISINVDRIHKLLWEKGFVCA